MLFCRFRGRLGNQMFQYAAVRTLAEELGCPALFARSRRSWRHSRLAKRLGIGHQGASDHLDFDGLLKRAFNIGPGLIEGHMMRWAAPLLKDHWFPQTFEIPTKRYPGGLTGEDPNVDISGISAGTELVGWFQSESFFSRNREKVCRWFTPAAPHQRVICEIEDRWGAPLERRCAIHVRRGDYGAIDDGLGGGSDGWILPASYYRRALELLPKGLFYVLLSDDPNWVDEAFSHLPHRWVSRNNEPVVDMALMGRCRYNVIANSSFSWWGAWLNNSPDRRVLAPNFHLGWAKGFWYPEGIQTRGWEYIPAS